MDRVVDRKMGEVTMDRWCCRKNSRSMGYYSLDGQQCYDGDVMQILSRDCVMENDVQFVGRDRDCVFRP